MVNKLYVRFGLSFSGHRQPGEASRTKRYPYEESPSLVCKRMLTEKISLILEDPKERLEVLAES
jgi:hypothetical protein